MKESEQMKVHNAYQCLKYIRTAPGKVYEYELYPFLEQGSSLDRDQNVAKMINELFGLEFAICDVVESSYTGKGLNVIYTNPEYRLVLDLLLSEEANYALDRTVYMDFVEEKIKGSKAEVKVYYHEVKRRLDELLAEQPGQYYIAYAENIFKTWPREFQMDVVRGKDILSYFDGKELNLSGKFVLNPDISALQTNSDVPVVLKNFVAEGAIFKGDRISFDGAYFEGGVSFKGSIFKGDILSFRNAKFQLDESDYKGHKNNEITFRNCRMFIKSLMFDEIEVDGTEQDKLISLEDAVIEAGHISFSKIALNDTDLFCYQTLMGKADIHMIESRIAHSKLDFEDSVVGNIILLNVMAIPEVGFGFRSCESLIIENCNFTDNIFLKNMKVLSLRACRNQGKILTDWEGKVKDKKLGKNYPILLSIMRNQDPDAIKAEQFILLKENFLNIGQYDYEDEAFIQYMNYKHKHSPIRFVYGILKIIGKYGISPMRVLLTMLWTIGIFGVLNFGFSYLLPGAYSEGLGAGSSIMTRLGNAFYLSVSNLISYDCSIQVIGTAAIVSSILESMIGWFLLGYLSVAVVRKTLR